MTGRAPPCEALRSAELKRRYLLLVSLLLACHRAEPAARSRPAEPVNVAVAMVGCANAAACEDACRSGGAGECVEAGRLYEYGHAGRPNAAHAFTLYDRACALGSASGCFNTALLLEIGRGVPRDAPRAAVLYRKVCQMGSKTACRRVEDLSPSSAQAIGELPGRGSP
jgi:TPR repeat protein